MTSRKKIFYFNGGNVGCQALECGRARYLPGEGTPYDGQCTMLSGLEPHFRAWLDPLGSIFEPGSIP